jgi:hypothetical protein
MYNVFDLICNMYIRVMYALFSFCIKWKQMQKTIFSMSIAGERVPAGDDRRFESRQQDVGSPADGNAPLQPCHRS